MDLSKKPLRQLLLEINDPRRDILLQIYDDYQDLFHFAAGSGANHQAWQGGYGDHIAECLRVNDATYAALEAIRPLPFSKDSAAIALFFHDIEKPFRYGPPGDPRCEEWRNKFQADGPAWEHAKWEILDMLNQRYGLAFSDEETNAIKYTHGEGSDHKKDQRITTPLAAHVHHCDNTSARIWFDKGQGLSAPSPKTMLTQKRL